MDVKDRKILHTEFFKSSVYYYSSYTWSKIDEKKLQLLMKKYSVSKRLLTVNSNSHADSGLPTHSFREKAVRIERKTAKIKFCHKKSTYR